MVQKHRDSYRPRSRARTRNPRPLILIAALTLALGIAAAVGLTQTNALALITASNPVSPVPAAKATPSGSAEHDGRGASEARFKTTPASTATSSFAATSSPKESGSPKLTHPTKPASSAGSNASAGSTPSAGRGASEASLETTAKNRFLLPLSKNPYDSPSQELRAQRATASPSTLTLLKRLAAYPIADWYGGTTSSVKSSVAYRVRAAAKQNAVAQLVVYNLPNRDCEGGYSASTLSSTQYKAWFRTFIAGLGSHKAIVILEPDALMQLQCLTPAQKAERYDLLSWATSLLHDQGSWTYIDAGHSAGLSVTTTASRLRRAGVANAAGFSLNVSGFRSNAESITYGTAISRQVGGKHFLIDSSRNGVTPKDADWCNPSGKGLGHAPTARTGAPLLDAYLWVKTPGSSDGTCNGGPSSGAWFQSYALTLARNAHLG